MLLFNLDPPLNLLMIFFKKINKYYHIDLFGIQVYSRRGRVIILQSNSAVIMGVLLARDLVTD